VVCRAAADLCDAVEKCPGNSTSCPADAVSTSGTTCRAAAGACDVADTCNGSSMTCPDGKLAAGSAGSPSCTPYFCDGTLATCPTTCSAQTDCVAADYCNGTNCVPLLAASVTVPASDVGNVEKVATAGCGTSYQNNANNTEVGGAAGGCFGTNVFRDYFIFDLSTVQHVLTTTVTAATFSSTGGGSAGSYNKTITLSNYSGADPSNSANANATTFGNLASGATTYGTITQTSSNAPNPASFSFTAGLSDVQAQLGSGSLTLAGQYSSEASGQNALNLTPASTTLAVTVKCAQGYADCNGGADGCECASGVCSGSTCVTQLANGLGCSSGAGCTSTFCADGVCCNNACSGGTGDCQACSTATGATVNGTCGLRGAGAVCRASVGGCDNAEVCSGSSTTCPVDTQ
jgi:hypothetical protein